MKFGGPITSAILLPQFLALAAGDLAAIFEADPIRWERTGTRSDMTASGRLDALVHARLNQLQIDPANRCSDAVFLRRAFLGVIGTLPTAEEAESFLRNPDADRRENLIASLLERNEFADYWAMKWSDLLRVKAEFPINLWPNAVHAYYRWIHTSVRDNKPYDLFARELLTSSGSNFRVGQVNFYRAMQDREPRGIARTVALTFMGERAEKWPVERLDGMAGFFARVGYKSTLEWKEEIVFHDPSRDSEGLAHAAVFPDGTSVRLNGEKDPREVFADWLIDSANPWFARNIANRVWSWLMGRGIIHEPDDLRADNPPVNPALLRFLEQELVSSRYNLKHLFAVILNSETFQRSSLPRTDTPKAAANFAHYPLRRLEAEVLVDALNQITRTRESYSSPIPEPFTFIPEDKRSIALADGSITSSFLELFGRSSRDTGLESERGRNVTSAQRLHLLNSSHIQRKIERSPWVAIRADRRQDPRDVIQPIYLTVLSRYPAREEVEIVTNYLGVSQDTSSAFKDLVWALINSAEFQYLH